MDADEWNEVYRERVKEFLSGDLTTDLFRSALQRLAFAPRALEAEIEFHMPERTRRFLARGELAKP